MEIEDVLLKINDLKHDVAIHGDNFTRQNTSLVDEIGDLKAQFQNFQDGLECGSRLKKRIGLLESNMKEVRKELEDHFEGCSLTDLRVKESMKTIRGESEISIVPFCSYLRSSFCCILSAL